MSISTVPSPSQRISSSARSVQSTTKSYSNPREIYYESQQPSPRLLLHQQTEAVNNGGNKQNTTSLLRSLASKKSATTVLLRPVTPPIVPPPRGAKPDAQHIKYNRWQSEEEMRKRKGKKKEHQTTEAEEEESPEEIERERRRKEMIGGVPFVPTTNLEVMERNFSKDIWRHVEMSKRRVMFCKRGGQYQDEGFQPLKHSSEFLDHMEGRSPPPPSAASIEQKRNPGVSSPGSAPPAPSRKRSPESAQRPAQVSPLRDAVCRHHEAASARASRGIPPTVSTKEFARTPSGVLPQPAASSRLISRESFVAFESAENDMDGTFLTRGQSSRGQLRFVEDSAAFSDDLTGSPLLPNPKHLTANRFPPFPGTRQGSIIASPPPPRERKQSVYQKLAARFQVPAPWTTTIPHHEVQDVVQLAFRPHSTIDPKKYRPQGDQIEELKLLYDLMSATDEDFRDMINYRLQDVEQRGKFTEDRVKRVIRTPAKGEDGVYQHMVFMRVMQTDAKQFYVHGSLEVDRWHNDRDRVYDMKYRAMDILGIGTGDDTQPNTPPMPSLLHSSQGKEIRFIDEVMRSLRGSIASNLRVELVEERSRIQDSFHRKLVLAISDLFAAMSLTATVMMEALNELFHRDKAISYSEIKKWVESIPTDGLFMTDVISICFSVCAGLIVPIEYWLVVLRERMLFAVSSKTMVDLPDVSTDLQWILSVKVQDVGTHFIQWVCSVPFAKMLEDENPPSVKDAVVAHIAKIPPHALLEALQPLLDPQAAKSAASVSGRAQSISSSAPTQAEAHDSNNRAAAASQQPLRSLRLTKKQIASLPCPAYVIEMLQTLREVPVKQ